MLMTDDAAIIHVVDDDDAIRVAVSRLLRASGYQVKLYSSANDLLNNLSGAPRGCILLDVQMPGISGLQLQEALAKSGFTLPIIFLSGHGDIAMSVKGIKAGAEDFLTKPVDKKILLRAIEQALSHYDQRHERDVQLKTIRELVATLTPREKEVFGLVVRGKLNKQIAHELGTSERTIKAHRHNIVAKLKVQSTAELASIAERLGLLTAPNF
jgi:RNA polymerase sigma factor (sigma-70 family)